MRRCYTAEDYKKLIKSIRATLKDSAISTDIIVGFPGEKEENFQNTVGLLEEIRFDTIHVAAYSPRSGTQAERDMIDDVPAQEKKRRLQLVEELHERIAGEINSALLGKSVEVLVENEKKGKWQGRIKTNKLVFFTGFENLVGKLVQVKIERTGPWSLTGKAESIKA
jgi:tRNA-2-methylthio-N6-dimethylallyladenosine synthase